MQSSLSSRRDLDVVWNCGVCMISIYRGCLALTLHWSILAGVGCFGIDVIIDLFQVSPLYSWGGRVTRFGIIQGQRCFSIFIGCDDSRRPFRESRGCSWGSLCIGGFLSWLWLHCQITIIRYNIVINFSFSIRIGYDL